MRRLATALAACAFVVACPKPEAGTSPASVSPSATTPTAGSTGPSSQPAEAGESGEAHHEEHEKHAAVDRETVDADGVVRRGSPLTAALEATPVSVAVAKAKDLNGQKVKLTGKVTDVCTKMGCWFVVQGDKPEDKIRISTKAHNIFVPRSAVGMTATVEGTLAVKTLDAKTAQHFEDERELKAGEERKTITTDVNEIAIDVIGLEMKKAG